VRREDSMRNLGTIVTAGLTVLLAVALTTFLASL
jgi:hypothetical protein